MKKKNESNHEHYIYFKGVNEFKIIIKKMRKLRR